MAKLPSTNDCPEIEYASNKYITYGLGGNHCFDMEKFTKDHGISCLNLTDLKALVEEMEGYY